MVLPLGLGIVTGVLLLNGYGQLPPAAAGDRGRPDRPRGSWWPCPWPARSPASCRAPARPVDLSGLVSLLAIVVAIAFLAGIAYAIVAISAQTQLQEDLPPEVRGRVFGVLNMLISVASFLPIIIVGPIADLFGTSRSSISRWGCW